MNFFRKTLLVFMTVITCSTMFILPSNVYAVDGGQGSGSQGGGVAGGQTAAYDIGNQWSNGFGAFKMRVVYVDSNFNWHNLKTVVVYWPNTSDLNYSTHLRLVQNYASSNNLQLITSGPLADWARNILNNHSYINSTYGANGITEDGTVKRYVTASNAFNIDEKDLREDNPQHTRDNYNSYGYRIIIERLNIVGTYSNFYWQLTTRRDWAASHGGDELIGSDASWDLYTTENDIHLWAANRANNVDTHALAGTFNNPNIGGGYNILWFSTDQFRDYDYSIDAACVNCNSQDSENKAYIIQDTTDWEAIMNSSKMDGNAKTYFDRGNGVYCREEYRVYLPNVNNTIQVGTGRYFFVNPSASEMENITTTGIPNLKPVRVTKIRQCRGGDLNAYARNAESEFKQDTGTVTFKYNETNENSPYNMDSAEEMRRYDDPDSYSATINGNTLTMSVTYSYTLPQNYYQYIRMQDGLSMKRKPTNDSSELQKYINVGLPNLPVSFNNTNDNTGTSKAGDIQFSYALPESSRIAKAYTSSNDYFATSGNKVDNIYKKYKNGKMEDGDQDILNNSACAKMYGTSGSGFESCVKERTENKIGNCITLNNINNQNGYVCLILRDSDNGNKCEIRNGKYYYNGAEITKEDYDRICDSGNDNPPGTTPPGTTDNPPGDDDDDCSSEADANRLGRDWNPSTNTCCPVGTSYNSSTGTCDSDSDRYTCRIENGKYYDFSGNEITKEKFDEICPNGGTCYVSNGKYYDFDGNEISKEEYDRICPGSTTFKCPESECPYGCCPSGECAPMPDGTCPGSGGINVIYRPIDLKFPFPGQEGSETNARSTGTNWCAYEVATGRLDCSYDNKVSSYYAINKRSEVYTGEALYEITLDSDAISAVRTYNDKTNYDDWDLKCKDNGKACVSDFLDDVVDVSGLCANSNKSNFYSCDSSKKGSD